MGKRGKVRLCNVLKIKSYKGLKDKSLEWLHKRRITYILFDTLVLLYTL